MARGLGLLPLTRAARLQVTVTRKTAEDLPVRGGDGGEDGAEAGGDGGVVHVHGFFLDGARSRFVPTHSHVLVHSLACSPSPSPTPILPTFLRVTSSVPALAITLPAPTTTTIYHLIYRSFYL